MEGYGENVVLITIGRGPPVHLEETLSREGGGRIFPLFSRVIAEKLFTSD